MRALLNKLNQHAGEFNVSLIISIENEIFDQHVNEERVKSAIKEAGEKIMDRKGDYQFLIEKMWILSEKIDWDHPMKGIGIFVSPAVNEWVYFSSPVTEKIIVGETFETRDLVFEISHAQKCWLLLLSKNGAHLYHCEGAEVHQVFDHAFPMEYVEQFDFDLPPSRIRSTEGIEESQVKKIREKEFLRAVDHRIKDYLNRENLPLILGGVAAIMAMFDEITAHLGSIAGRIHGSFDHCTPAEIATMARSEIGRLQENDKQEMIQRMKEKAGTSRCVWGVRDVWNAAVEGKCDTLLVEKDYMVPALLDSELFKINLDGKSENFSPQMGDVVNNIIKVVQEKKGKIVFTANDELRNYGKIASLLRYS